MEALDKRWRKSSYSGNGGECVEVGNADDVLVRDTTQTGTGPVLRFCPDAWRRFANRVKRSLGRRIEVGMTGVFLGAGVRRGWWRLPFPRPSV